MSLTHRGGSNRLGVELQSRTLLSTRIEETSRAELFRALRAAGHRPRINLTNEELRAYALERAHDLRGRL